MRIAIVLLTLLAIAAIPGSLLPQRNVASDPVAVLQFTLKHPTISPWLDRFGFFEVYASPWFAAIYLLLLVSMTGCVLPRSRQLWKASRSAPPRAPRNLARLENHHSWQTSTSPGELLEQAASALRRAGFRVVADADQVRAERGFLREVGNLVFHLSLLVLLVGIGAGRLYGFEGRVAVIEGSSFTNVRSEYDAFTPSVWTDVDSLEPFSFTLDQFTASFETSGQKMGEPRGFSADLTSRTSAGDEALSVRPNRPLDVNGTKVFLTGHGYAPRVTVRDGEGEIAFAGPVIFLPLDGSFASDGVIKVPDAQPTQLGFEGLFLPTAADGTNGAFSAFPDALNPQLLMTAYTGDLGLETDGVAQSVFTLDKAQLQQVTEAGKPFRQALAVGDTMTLPDGQGSLTFDGVSRFANFQIAYDPGKEISLLAAVMLLLGLTASLCIRRRRIWVRVSSTPDASVTVVSLAGLSLTRRPPPEHEFHDLCKALGKPAPSPTTTNPPGDHR
ncbi:cytochrome c biogenesis protein ResB [Nocardioides sp.]